jgi:RNA polymerase sigma factor (sigma-70 family)
MHLLSRVPPERLPIVFAERDSTERRELHRAVWRTLQRWRRAPKSQPLDGQALVERRPAELRDDRSEAVAAVWHTITPRQQQVLTLWSQGYSIREIARKLGVPAPRISDEKYKALEKLRDQLV